MLDEDLDMTEDLDEYNNDETIQHFARKKREAFFLTYKHISDPCAKIQSHATRNYDGAGSLSLFTQRHALSAR